MWLSAHTELRQAVISNSCAIYQYVSQLRSAGVPSTAVNSVSLLSDPALEGNKSRMSEI